VLEYTTRLFEVKSFTLAVSVFDIDEQLNTMAKQKWRLKHFQQLDEVRYLAIFERRIINYRGIDEH
jgi:hypothetical protein